MLLVFISHRVVHLEPVALPGLDGAVLGGDPLLDADLQLLLRIGAGRGGHRDRCDDGQEQQQDGLGAHFDVQDLRSKI